jgi:hypothetical protein
MSDLTPSMERDLAAVEDALATGSATAADPAERELRELALALAADAPAPAPAFAAALRERVDGGFPPAPDSARGRVKAGLDRLVPRRLSLTGTGLGAGAVAALLIAVVVAVALNGGEQASDDAAGGDATALQEPAPGPGAAESRSAAPEDGGTADIAPATPTPPPAGRGDFAPGREQRIARSAALTLEARGDELGRVADRVTAVTDRHRGFVLRSSVTSGTDGDAGGTLELRIPADDLRATVRALSALATVTSSTQSGADVTGRFVSAHDRLDAARAERVGLLKRLEDADTDAEVEALRRRLDLVAGEINGLRGQLRRLRLKTNYAAVTVALEPADGDAGAAVPGSTKDALDDAIGSLQGALNVTLRVLGVALPLGAVALLAWLVGRAVRRRRRESVLA